MANEKLLIDARDLWSDIMMLPHNGDMISSEEVEQAIKDAPTVDAVEVVRDMWIPVTDRLPESERIVLVSALTKGFRHRHTLIAAHIGHHEATTEDYGWQEYEGDTEYDEEEDCFWIPECWWEVNAVDGNENWILDSEYEVTHWMPIPEPPKVGERQ